MGSTILYIARAFASGDDGALPLEAMICGSAEEAIFRAEKLSLTPGHIAAIAYSVVGDLVSGDCDALMLCRFECK
jgi:hypothetical protein